MLGRLRAYSWGSRAQGFGFKTRTSAGVLWGSVPRVEFLRSGFGSFDSGGTVSDYEVWSPSSR